MPWPPIPALDDNGCPCGAGGTTGCDLPPCCLDQQPATPNTPDHSTPEGWVVSPAPFRAGGACSALGRGVYGLLAIYLLCLYSQQAASGDSRWDDHMPLLVPFVVSQDTEKGKRGKTIRVGLGCGFKLKDIVDVATGSHTLSRLPLPHP
jgi:hypothetical protein